ncbi:MAG: branched-chain amino acid transport system substrate-binding protein [Alphaproteobacteria bacterium]|nr:branched-chain amino acid transport system substrate-binding protein [Alphaproteobacteria bacterium]
MKMPVTRNAVTIGLAGVLVLTAAAAKAAWWSSDTVTLGAAVQLTGNLAGTGRYYRDAYQFMVDKINEKGGISVGGKTYKLALKLLDSKSDSTLGSRLHERMVSKDKVDFLLGPFSSNDVLAGSSVAEKHQVPMIQAGGASSRIFSRGYKYVFGTLPSADDYFRSTIEMLEQLKPEARTVGLVSGDDAFDASLSGATNALLKKAGLEVVLDQQYSERIPNFYNILTLIKSKAPDVLLWSGHEAGAISFIRAAKSRKINPNLLSSFTVGVSSANFRKVLGKEANYAFGMTPWLPSERLRDRWFGDASQFASAYEQKFRYAPDYHAAAAVAAVQAYVMAIDAAGTLDPKQVRDAIAKVDFESVYGRVRFGENGQIVLPQTVIQIQDDKVIEVYTDKLVNPPVYPVPSWDKRS